MITVHSSVTCHHHFPSPPLFSYKFRAHLDSTLSSVKYMLPGGDGAVSGPKKGFVRTVERRTCTCACVLGLGPNCTCTVKSRSDEPVVPRNYLRYDEQGRASSTLSQRA